MERKTRPGAEFFLGNKKIKGSRTTGELYYLSSMCIFMGSRKCGKLQHSIGVRAIEEERVHAKTHSQKQAHSGTNSKFTSIKPLATGIKMSNLKVA